MIKKLMSSVNVVHGIYHANAVKTGAAIIRVLVWKTEHLQYFTLKRKQLHQVQYGEAQSREMISDVPPSAPPPVPPPPPVRTLVSWKELAAWLMAS